MRCFCLTHFSIQLECQRSREVSCHELGGWARSSWRALYPQVVPLSRLFAPIHDFCLGTLQSSHQSQGAHGGQLNFPQGAGVDRGARWRWLGSCDVPGALISFYPRFPVQCFLVSTVALACLDLLFGSTLLYLVIARLASVLAIRACLLLFVYLCFIYIYIYIVFFSLRALLSDLLLPFTPHTLFHLTSANQPMCFTTFVLSWPLLCGLGCVYILPRRLA